MKTKKFDCVRMKHEIQQAILEEMDALTPEERRRKTEERILTDPILGPVWSRSRRDKQSPVVSDSTRPD